MGIYEYGGRNYGDPQRARQARYADESKSFFQYGSTDPSRIATLQAQDQQWQANTANAIAMRQKQAALENELRAKRDDERQRNVLGLSPLANQLADPNSAAYRWEMDNEQTPAENGFRAEMTIGDEAGGAPAPLPMVRPRLGRLSRTIKPEFQQAQQQMRAEDSERVAPMQSPYENPIRQQQADTDEIGTLTKMLESLDEDDPLRAPVMERIKNKLTPMQPAMQPRPFSQPAAIQPTPFSGVQSANGTPTLDEFAVRYRGKFPNATPEEIQAEYNRRLGRQ